MKAQNNVYLKASLIFFFFFLLFFSVHWLGDGFISNDDPYYHAKHAQLIERSGNLTLTEPWLEFHFLNYAPVDPWWGYHLLLALFIHCFGLILGVKILSSFLAALVFLIFYLILNNLNLKYPAVWTCLLFFASSIFEYRLFLERPHLLSIIILPLGLWLLIREKYFWLFLLALFYALAYQLAPLVILPALIFSAVGACFNKRLNLKPLIAAAGGVLAGIIIHPHSLNYLYVIFISFFEIFFLKFSGIDLDIGGELRLMDFSGFVYNNFLVLSFYAAAAVLFLALRKYDRNKAVSWFLFLYSGFWFLVALLVLRGVEYWLPSAVLFIALMFNNFWPTTEFNQIKHWLKSKINLKVLGFFLVSLTILIIFNNLINIFSPIYEVKKNSDYQSFEQANFWLKSHTEKNSIIFYDNWGMWPMMFYFNDYNHYITGMDPTFLYEYDARTYWIWRNLIADGLFCDQPRPCSNISLTKQAELAPWAIKNIFRADYAVLINNQDGKLIKNFNNLPASARLVFKSRTLIIYEIK